MDGTGELFTDFVNALPEAFQTVAVRYPADRFLSYTELAGLVRDSCPVSEPFVLVAESFSSPLAIQYAAANPTNLAALILCAGFASSPVHGWRRLFASLCAPIVFRIPLPKFFADSWLVGPDAHASFLKAVQAAISSVKPGVLAARLREVLDCEALAELGQITVPILYIQAEQDRLVGASCLEEIRRIKPQVAVATLEGPHLLLQREPHPAAAVVSEFLRGFDLDPITWTLSAAPIEISRASGDIESSNQGKEIEPRDTKSSRRTIAKAPSNIVHAKGVLGMLINR
jgi:pimeloyl-ACP methyl ester carboxylesterase